MGLLTNLLRGELSELAISPEMIEYLARKRRLANDDHNIASGGSADLGFAPISPNVAVPTPTTKTAPAQAAGVPTGVGPPHAHAPYASGGGTGQPAAAMTGGNYAPGTPTADDPRGMIPVIRAAALRYGHDPDVAIQVARSEGLLNPKGDHGTSFGAFQLHTGGGLGDEFQKQTGLDPSDPKNEPATIDFAMKNLGHTGWGPYHGAARSGIQQRAGISVTQPQPTQQASTTSGTTGAALNKYAVGNARLGGASSVEGVHPEFAGRIMNMVQAMPPDIAAKFNIISGHRSPERQAQVNPGVTNSHHAPGMAVDTTWDPDVRNWITQNGSKFGVGYTIANLPHEGNHLEPTENGQRISPAQMNQWAQAHMPTTSTSSSGTQTASKGGSGGIGSTISNALSSIGNAVIPSAHAETMPPASTPSSTAAALPQQTASAAPVQQAPPVQAPPSSVPPPDQVASAAPVDKIPQVESLTRPAIYLIRPLNIRSALREP